MDFQEIAARLDDIRTYDPKASVRTIMVKLGQLSEQSMLLEGIEDEADVPEEDIDEMRRDAIAGTIMACFDFAAQHDIDMEKAVEERIEMMEDLAETREAIDEAVEADDAEALADALGAETNEVPTDRDPDDRMFQ